MEVSGVDACRIHAGCLKLIVIYPVDALIGCGDLEEFVAEWGPIGIGCRKAEGGSYKLLHLRSLIRDIGDPYPDEGVEPEISRLRVERHGEEQDLGLLLVPEKGERSLFDPLVGGEVVHCIGLGIEGELL